MRLGITVGCNSLLCGAAPYLTEATPFPLPRTLRWRPTTNKAFELSEAGKLAVSRNASGAYLGSAFGIQKQVTPRKAPTIVNAAYRDRLFYDGRAIDGTFTDPVTGQVVATGDVALENLIKGPPLNTVEMGHVGRSWTDVAAKIATARPLALASNIPTRLSSFIGGAVTYNQLFEQVYGPGAVATPTRMPTRTATSTCW